VTSNSRKFPCSVAELTTSWLTSVLRAAGALEPSAEITDFRAERIAEGVGFASYLYRIHLDVDSGRGPTTVIVKWPTDYQTYLELATQIRLYEREVSFYKHVATSAPLSTPRVYFAEINDGTTEFVILMEDLRDLENADHLAGLSIDRVERVLDELARFHAWGWNLTPTASNDQAFLSIDDQRMVGLFSAGAAVGWPLYLAHGRATPPGGFGEMIGGFTSAVPILLKYLTEPTTLVNGDLRADNLFFDGAARHFTVDFQFTGRGSGMWDVAYLVGQGLDPAVRGGRERDLVHRYVSALADQGIEYPYERAWEQFQIAVVAQVALPLLAMMSWDTLNSRGKELLQVLMERCFQIIADTDALGIVRAVTGQ
jgi:Ecdysteroid kinase-like family